MNRLNDDRVPGEPRRSLTGEAQRKAALEQEQQRAMGQVEQLEARVREEADAACQRLEPQGAALKQEREGLLKRREGLLQQISEEAAASDAQGNRLRELRIGDLRQERTHRQGVLDTLITELDADWQVRKEAVQTQEDQASEAYADIGLRYPEDDPRQPPDYRPEDVAAENGFNLNEKDRHPVPELILWAVTVVSGVAAGFSLGLAVHFLHADTLRRELHLAVLCSLFGLATSIALKYALEWLWGEVSERLHNLKPWKVSMAVALTLTLLAIAVYSTVERRGLMSPMMLEVLIRSVRNGGGAASPAPDAGWELTATFASVFLTLPYFLLACSTGFRKARYDAVFSRVTAMVKARRDAYREGGKDNQKVRHAVAQAKLADSRKEELAAFAAEAERKKGALRNEIAGLDRSMELALAEPVAPSARLLELRRQEELANRELERVNYQIEETERQLKQLGGSEPEVPSAGRLAEAVAKVKALEAELRAARLQDEKRQGIFKSIFS